MTAFLARIGDRINPIVVKESRQAVNSRLVAGFLLLFLAVQLVVMLLMIISRDLSNSDEMNLRAGRELFTFVQGILLGTCMVLIPTMAGLRLAVERSDVNVDLLFISSLTPRAVLSGKLIAAAGLALLIFSACAPFMTFAYVMRGLDVPTILVVLVADYLAVLLGTAFSLFLASIPANRGLRIFLGLGGFIGLCYLGGGLLSLSAAFLHFGEFQIDTMDFWLGSLGVMGLTFGGIGLLFVWSVALISPPAANRAFIVRLYTLAFWLALAAGCGGWSLYIRDPEPILVWGVLGSVLFSLQMVIAVSERDQWGARVARRIPTLAILRAPAFLLYSGAAGGLAFAVIGAVVNALGVVIWYAVVPPPTRYNFEDKPALIVALIPAYTYCYAMTAAVIRRLLTNTPFRAGYTWLIAAILFGLGCTMPFILGFTFFDRYSRYGYSDDTTVLYAPNPVVMIGDAVGRSNSHIGLTIFFLVVWGGAATMVNANWLVRQVLRFRPPRPDEGAEE